MKHKKYKPDKRKKQLEPILEEDENTPEQVKMYLLNFTDTITRSIYIEPVKSRKVKDVSAGFQIFFARIGAPRLIISDADPTFAAVGKDIARQQSLWKKKKETQQNGDEVLQDFLLSEEREKSWKNSTTQSSAPT